MNKRPPNGEEETCARPPRPRPRDTISPHSLVGMVKYYIHHADELLGKVLAAKVQAEGSSVVGTLSSEKAAAPKGVQVIVSLPRRAG